MHPRYIKPLADLPAPLQAALTPMLGDDFKARFSVDEIALLKQASGLDDRALRLALLPLAAACAVVPISNFYVGAIASGQSGTWYFGANMEFAGQGLFHSIHAEQSAISHAWLSGETGISEVTVNHTPCGHCRQFMNELTTAKSIRITLPHVHNSLQAFLPDSFGPADLDIKDALMSPQQHPLQCDARDPLVQAALGAARQSYAPYTANFAGVAVEFANGHVYTGRYAENAAFNPSLPPLQMACTYASLMGESLPEIRRAVLVEPKQALISQRENARTTLLALGQVELEYHGV
jgi:cytidine deaminase